ncbi:hypothetical protein J6590_022896 [Homalodisca vitripennis]|nr:hypothetical protein J6590_022896 [Homalodisca vitripennis]
MYRHVNTSDTCVAAQLRIISPELTKTETPYQSAVPATRRSRTISWITTHAFTERTTLRLTVTLHRHYTLPPPPARAASPAEGVFCPAVTAQP